MEHHLDLEQHQDIDSILPTADKVMEKPSFAPADIRRYFATRFSELIPTKEYMNANRDLLNPLPGLKEITWKQWKFILCAFMGWTWDAFDFFTISLNVHVLSEQLHKSTTDIT